MAYLQGISLDLFLVLHLKSLEAGELHFKAKVVFLLSLCISLTQLTIHL